jgi:hypothetical protein
VSLPGGLPLSFTGAAPTTRIAERGWRRTGPRPAQALARGLRRPNGLEQLDAIPERVGDVSAVISRQRFIRVHRIPRTSASLEKSLQIDDEQRRVCLLRGLEIILDAQVNMSITRAEPRAATACEVPGFRFFSHAEYIAIEPTRVILAPTGHCELNVVKGSDHLRRPGVLVFIKL